MRTDLRSLATLLAITALVAVCATGCYTGHGIDRQKLLQLSNASEASEVTSVEDEDGETLPVTTDTIVVVTDNAGLQHPIQAFTYQVSSTQLVAPEADLILGLASIERIEVRKLSTLATLGLIGVGVATAATAGVAAIATAGDSSFD